MLNAILRFIWFIIKMYLRIAFMTWLIQKTLPDPLDDAVLAIYIIIVIGKFICGGYFKKREN